MVKGWHDDIYSIINYAKLVGMYEHTVKKCAVTRRMSSAVSNTKTDKKTAHLR